MFVFVEECSLFNYSLQLKLALRVYFYLFFLKHITLWNRLELIRAPCRLSLESGGADGSANYCWITIQCPYIIVGLWTFDSRGRTGHVLSCWESWPNLTINSGIVSIVGHGALKSCSSATFGILSCLLGSLHQQQSWEMGNWSRFSTVHRRKKRKDSQRALSTVHLFILFFPLFAFARWKKKPDCPGLRLEYWLCSSCLLLNLCIHLPVYWAVCCNASSRMLSLARRSPINGRPRNLHGQLWSLSDLMLCILGTSIAQIPWNAVSSTPPHSPTRQSQESPVKHNEICVLYFGLIIAGACWNNFWAQRLISPTAVYDVTAHCDSSPWRLKYSYFAKDEIYCLVSMSLRLRQVDFTHKGICVAVVASIWRRWLTCLANVDDDAGLIWQKARGLCSDRGFAAAPHYWG